MRAVIDLANELKRDDGVRFTLDIAPGGDAGDAATWDNAFLVSESFSRKPNRLLTEAVQGVKPGAALDVGMGQGRNAVWLATRGWQVTGFDVAGEGLRLAREQAGK